MYTTKKLSWAYPGSPGADRYGYGDTGCWIVEIMLDPLDSTGLFREAYLVKRDAIAHINDIDLPLDGWTMPITQ